MIFGIGFALFLVCPIAHGTFEPKPDGWFERLLTWGFILGLILMVASWVLFLIGRLP